MGTNWFKNSKQYHLVGKVKEAHGIRGELYLLLFAKRADWLEQLEKIHLEKEEPHGESDQRTLSIQKLRAHKSGLILKSPDLNDRNEAETLKGYLFYIPAELLVAPSGERPYLIELLGFRITDPEKNFLGEVSGFSSNGAQDLLVVKTAQGDFEVPYVDAFIRAVDYENQVLEMDLPEGLLE